MVQELTIVSHAVLARRLPALLTQHDPTLPTGGIDLDAQSFDRTLGPSDRVGKFVPCGSTDECAVAVGGRRQRQSCGELGGACSAEEPPWRPWCSL